MARTEKDLLNGIAALPRKKSSEAEGRICCYWMK